MKKTPLISIVFPTLNDGLPDVIKLMKSISKLNYPKNKIEIIMVDNGSTDNTIPYMKKNYSKVKVIENKINLGSPKALNKAVKISKGDYFIRLDNDIQMDPECINEMLKTFSKDSKAAAVAAKLYHDEYGGKVIRNLGWSYSFFTGKSFVRAKDKEDIGQFNEDREMDFVGGGVAMYNRAIFNKVGYFDERYFICLEDLDWDLRAHKLGYKIYCSGKAKLWHKTFSAERTSQFRMYHLMRSKMIFHLTWGGWKNIIFFPLYFIFTPFRLLGYVLQGRFDLPIPYTRGIIVGLTDHTTKLAYKGMKLQNLVMER